MVLSWSENKKYILELVLDYIYKQKDLVDILVQVNVEVHLKAECPLKYYGLEDKEFSEDS